MESKLFRINLRDVAKGLVMAVLGAVVTFILQMADMPGFSVYAIDWSEIARIGFAASMTYILKNFLSTSDGKVMGTIG